MIRIGCAQILESHDIIVTVRNQVLQWQLAGPGQAIQIGLRGENVRLLWPDAVQHGHHTGMDIPDLELDRTASIELIQFQGKQEIDLVTG